MLSQQFFRILFRVCILLVFTAVWVDSLSSPASSKSIHKRPADGNKLLILGLGRVGSEVAFQSTKGKDSLIAEVFGSVRDRHATTTTPENENDQVRCVWFQSEDLPCIASQCNYMLVTIPPPPPPSESQNDDDSSSNYDKQQINIFQNVIQELKPNCWIGLISTTGVYGNHDGEWVTEDTECKAESPTARQFLRYESQWAKWATSYGHVLRIFRCSGIYSNNTSALHTVYKTGIEMKQRKSAKSVTNRIHLYDLAQAIVSSMKQHNNDKESKYPNENPTCRIYNLSDNLPESRTVVMEYATMLLQKKGVVVEEKEASNSDSPVSSRRARRRQTDQKRVSNQRMVQELLPHTGLKFPTYKEGLIDILNFPDAPWCI